MSDLEPTLGSRPQSPTRALPLALGAAGYLILMALGTLTGGELRQIALASLNTLPFAGLALLAYLGGRRFNWAWVAGGLWLLLMISAAALLAFSTAALVVLDLQVGPQPGRPPPITTGAALQLILVALLIIIAFGLSALTLFPLVRRALARIIPIDPDSLVHAIALVCVASVGLICFVPLLVLGEPPLLAVIEQTSGALSAPGGRDSAGMLRDQLYSLVWTIPATILAVGYGVRRGLGQALERLGLVRPSLRQVGTGIAIALLLVVGVQLLGLGMDWLWRQMGWPTTNEEAFAELLSFALSPVGALVIGVTAGLGEELAVRGVLQPRLGLLLSNLFFVSLHALQYNWDALLVVFVVGMVCGLVRKRTNTTTAAIVHGVYNFTLVMLAVMGVGG